ncbi:MAG: hypothetical protein KDK78_10510 [Chlamydiia bacterium]|nr:hypothetical protein [Chlamydiia bacterium]
MKKDITEISRSEWPQVSQALTQHGPCKVVAVAGDHIYVYLGKKDYLPKSKRAPSNLSLAEQVTRYYKKHSQRLRTCEPFLALIGALRSQLRIRTKESKNEEIEINQRALHTLRQLPPPLPPPPTMT